MKRVLLIDDDEALLNQLKDLLAGLDVESDLITNDSDALGHLEENVYDFVFLDLRMAEDDFTASRFAFCAAIKRKILGARLIGMTGGDLTATQAYELGKCLLDDFVEKRDINQAALRRLLEATVPMSPTRRRFCVALSYPSEYREMFVKPVADCLAYEFGRRHVFYDQFHQAELPNVDADILLQRIYARESELVVVMLAPEYVNSPWCKREWRAIRGVIDNPRSRALMPIRIGKGKLHEILPDAAILLDATNLTPAEVAERIIKRIDNPFLFER
ncbi:MAG: TIR domain-containing protein [Deltaproteobacteria bacterium]|nr:TIR domain-containing protein [Deltaproteobacteria bacterium]